MFARTHCLLPFGRTPGQWKSVKFGGRQIFRSQRDEKYGGFKIQRKVFSPKKFFQNKFFFGLLIFMVLVFLDQRFFGETYRKMRLTSQTGPKKLYFAVPCFFSGLDSDIFLDSLSN